MLPSLTMMSEKNGRRVNVVYYKSCRIKCGSFGQFWIQHKENRRAHIGAFTPLQKCFFFVHTVYQDFRQSFRFGVNVILPNVILSSEFLVESAATVRGPSATQYCYVCWRRL